MAECRHLRLPFVMEYAAEHFSLDIAWPEQRLGIEVSNLQPIRRVGKSGSRQAALFKTGKTLGCNRSRFHGRQPRSHVRMPWQVDRPSAAEQPLGDLLLMHTVGAQVDGPTHFTANTLQPLGPTLLKRRQLEAAGWRLLSVPFHEWIQLSGRDAKQVPLHCCCTRVAVVLVCTRVHDQSAG